VRVLCYRELMLCGGGKGFGALLQLTRGRNQQTREVFDLQSPTGVAECAELESAKRFRYISKRFHQIFKVISSWKSLSKSPRESGDFVYCERPYWSHTLSWASQLQVAGCCPTEVDAIPWLLTINRSYLHQSVLVAE
jgi:hypothetical protein